MKIRVEIECVNSIFEDDFHREVKRICRSIPGKVMKQLERPQCICDAPEVSDKLMDINGNTVGSVRLVKEGDIDEGIYLLVTEYCIPENLVTLHGVYTSLTEALDRHKNGMNVLQWDLEKQVGVSKWGR